MPKKLFFYVLLKARKDAGGLLHPPAIPKQNKKTNIVMRRCAALSLSCSLKLPALYWTSCPDFSPLSPLFLKTLGCKKWQSPMNDGAKFNKEIESTKRIFIKLAYNSMNLLFFLKTRPLFNIYLLDLHIKLAFKSSFHPLWYTIRTECG